MSSLPAPRTAGDMLQRGRDFLARKQVPESRLAAELLVAHALGFDRLKLFLELDRPVTSGEIESARELLVRRGKREPVAYITGQREFYGRPFKVTRDVLIPRPETELLVDLARELIAAHPQSESGLTIGDFGTGSGNIAITLALEVPSSAVHAVDLSPQALERARENARQLGAEVRFVAGDTPAALCQGEHAPDALDLLISNPPYVTREEAPSLEAEVRDFEPELALFAPPGQPHFWIERLLDEGLGLLRPGGFLLVELGHRQQQAALALVGERGLQASVHGDLDGVPRVLEVPYDSVAET